MRPFRLFLSHCDSYPSHSVIRPLYDLISEAFIAEIKAKELEILYDGLDPVPPGQRLRESLVDLVGECDLVVACFFPRWRDAQYFKDEVLEAIKRNIQVVPLLVLGPTGTENDLGLGQFHPSFVDPQTGRLEHVAVKLNIDPSAESIADKIRERLGSSLGGDLIRTIRTAFIDRAKRDLTMYETSDAVLTDLPQSKSDRLHIFLYDGGNTVRRLAYNPEVAKWLTSAGSGMQVRFLYVDTDFRAFVETADEFKKMPGLDGIESRFYAPLYESLVRQSGMVHNDSPRGHIFDVQASVSLLSGLAEKYGFSLEIRKTWQLPFYRMLVTQEYIYYTHLLPVFPDALSGVSSPEYYSLRLSARSPAGRGLSGVFDRLWQGARPQ